MRAIYLFKRDLRIRDNRGICEASRNFKELVPIFIFDPKIIEELKAQGERLYYVYRAVEELLKSIRLYCFYEDTESAIRKAIKVAKPKALYTTTSYSWSGLQRQEVIRKVCKEEGVEFVEFFENFLVKPEKVPLRKVYTPFYKEWIKDLYLETCEVQSFEVPALELPTLEDIKKELPIKPFGAFDPSECEKRLESFNFESYERLRNYPALDGTSKLSPCIRFGILSLRHIYKKAEGRSEQFIKELAWREFWYHIALHYPEVRNLEFQEKRRSIRWENRENFIEAFFEAKTGYPFVDAGILQLKTEKWLHNRMRMVLASFLTKVLLVDWRIGEAFFKEHLLDYDEIVNAGNWQWSASVGADPKPFRLFNPILQAQRYDPECKYIKRYLPELSSYPCEELLDPLRHRLTYHKPAVNYYERINMAKSLYRNF
ncbi:MAG: deoxyribodipyrimidine photo-lyase [Hydrogenobacter sp.]|uniref:cryptochrome/photolyase family protein n=1 Tax=Hydrogenobacter thermophilus TaxID=940 RepID=UPI0030FCF074